MLYCLRAGDRVSYKADKIRGDVDWIRIDIDDGGEEIKIDVVVGIYWDDGYRSSFSGVHVGRMIKAGRLTIMDKSKESEDK